MTAQAILAAALVAVTLLSAAPDALAQEPSLTGSDADLLVELELDLSAVPEELRGALDSAIRAELATLGEEEGFVPTTGDGSELLIHVEARSPEPEVYMLDTWTEYEGTKIDQRIGEACMACTNEELSAASLSLVPAAVEHARAQRASEEPPAPVAPVEVDTSPPVAEPRVPPIGPAGYVGIASTGVGLGLAIFGAVYIHRGKVTTSDPTAPILDYTDYRPAGIALVGAGLGAMVLGNVLIGVDLGVLRSRREGRARVEIAGLSFAVDQGASLAIRGRF